MKRVLTLAVFLQLIGFTNAQSTKYRFGEGLKLTSRDSSFHVKATGRIQTLYSSDKALSDPSGVEKKLSIRRARFKADGYLLNPRFAFKLELGLSSRDRDIKVDQSTSWKIPHFLLDAVLKYAVDDHWEVWFGQTKLPGNRERVVSSQNLQMVDRSLVNSIFNLDREMGVQLRSKWEMGSMVIRPAASISLGESRNSVFSSLGGYRYTGRIELLPLGDFQSKGDYYDSDLVRESTPKIMLGITLSHNDHAVRQKTTGKYLVSDEGNYLHEDLSTFFTDLILKYQGISFSMEYAHKGIVRNSQLKSGTESQKEILDANNQSFYTGSGINLQLGYLFGSNTEIATRWTRVVPDRAWSFKEAKEYTIGLSQYFNGHKLKLQTDLSYTDMGTTNPDRLRYRIQMEVAF